MNTWRHEFKYETDHLTAAALESRLSALLSRDPHAGPDGTYPIRSLYFDDWRDQCLHDNEDGVDPREKFRLRIYNADPSLIHLELKRRDHEMTGKLQEVISEDLCRRILSPAGISYADTFSSSSVQNCSGEKNDFADTGGSSLLRKLWLQQESRRLRPVILVEYERTPFICPDGNVRITFDRNIRGGLSTDEFTAPDPFFRPVMPAGREIIEVKYDEFLPDPIARITADRRLQRVAYSKYALCRRLCG